MFWTLSTIRITIKSSVTRKSKTVLLRVFFFVFFRQLKVPFRKVFLESFKVFFVSDFELLHEIEGA